MNGQTIILASDVQRRIAHEWVDVAPWRAVLNIQEMTRSLEQNARFWAMVSDVSRAKPDGRVLPPHKWKPIFMDACGHRPEFEANLEQDGFVCLGYKSSRLSKTDFTDLITCVAEYGDRHRVRWSEPNPYEQAA